MEESTKSVKSKKYRPYESHKRSNKGKNLKKYWSDLKEAGGREAYIENDLERQKKERVDQLDQAATPARADSATSEDVLLLPDQHSPSLMLINSTPNSPSVPELLIAPPQLCAPESSFSGLRIVDLIYFQEQLFDLESHDKILNCGIRHIKFVSEDRKGFRSCLTYKCGLCNKKFKIGTHRHDGFDVNRAAVTSALCSGMTHEMQHELFGAMNIPALSVSRFYEIQKDVESEVCDIAFDDMIAAGKEEKQIAVSKGQIVTVNGEKYPWIAVKADGTWQRRSYKGNYNSLLGAAAIIGAETGKIIFAGTRSKYCAICRVRNAKTQSAEDESAQIEHECTKNWDQSSGAMEASIITEGFCKSIQMHGLVYKDLIADGDCSTAKSILHARPYGHQLVQKFECKNHLWRAFGSHMNILVTTSNRAHPPPLRRVVAGRISKLRSKVNKHIKKRSEGDMPDHKKALYLKKDIVRSIHCIFNDHSGCEQNSELCTEKDKNGSENFVASLKLTPMWAKIIQHLQRLINNTSSLIANKDSNIVESLNSVIAKMTANKGRLFLASYKLRVFTAIISFNNKGKAFSIVWRRLVARTPGTHTKRMEMRREKKNHPTERKPRRKLRFSKDSGKSASTNGMKYDSGMCSEPILSGVDLEASCLARLETYPKTEEQRKEIERSTADQSDCPAWKEMHCYMLTASNHGAVCKRRETTSCKNQVYQFLYSDLSHIASIAHGNDNEHIARKILAQKLGVQISLAGMFVSEDHPFLGASPDGLIGSDTLVEIKCPSNAIQFSPIDAVLNGTISYMIAEEVSGRRGKSKPKYKFSLKKNHNYYYQIQSQLHFSKREMCIFAIYTPIEPHILTVEVTRDRAFYQEMEPKLIKFFKLCMLPEIVNPMFRRSNDKNDIREPQYILDAIARMSTKKQQNPKPK